MFYNMQHVIYSLHKTLFSLVATIAMVVMVASPLTAAYASDVASSNSAVSSNEYGATRSKSEFENRRDAKNDENSGTHDTGNSSLLDNQDFKTSATTGVVVIVLFFIVAGIVQVSSNREMRREFEDNEKRLNEEVRMNDESHDAHMDSVYKRLREKHSIGNPVITDSPLMEKSDADIVDDGHTGDSIQDTTDAINDLISGEDKTSDEELNVTGDGDDEKPKSESDSEKNDTNGGD